MSDANAADTFPNKLGIVGLGLIGGSVACAARQHSCQITAYDTDIAMCKQAAKENIIHTAADNIGELTGCDLIVIAVPVRATEKIFAALAKQQNTAADVIITDTGSVKRSVIAAARTQLGEHARRFVPAHPIAGKENSSLAAAAPDLFHRCKTILCPDESDDTAVTTVKNFWRTLGADVVMMTAEKHDRIFSAVSHLPHLLSYALVNVIYAHPDRDELMEYAAGGFRDFTRIASSHPIMWRDIALANSDHLTEALAAMHGELKNLSTLIAQRDADALQQKFQTAKDTRARWLKKFEQ